MTKPVIKPGLTQHFHRLYQNMTISIVSIFLIFFLLYCHFLYKISFMKIPFHYCQALISSAILLLPDIRGNLRKLKKKYHNKSLQGAWITHLLKHNILSFKGNNSNKESSNNFDLHSFPTRRSSDLDFCRLYNKDHFGKWKNLLNLRVLDIYEKNFWLLCSIYSN